MFHFLNGPRPRRARALVTALVLIGVCATAGAPLAARAAAQPSSRLAPAQAARGLVAAAEGAGTGPYGTLLIAGCAWATWVTNCSNLGVYGNGTSFDDNGCGAPNGCTFGSEFQCDELAQRYAYYAWGEPETWYGYGGDQGAAYQMWAAGPALPKPLQQFPNGGGSPPRVGDILVFNQGWLGSYWDGAGHVAIVSSVDQSDGLLTVAEQNATSTGSDTFALSGSTVTADGYTPIIGWLRPLSVTALPAMENTTAFPVSWSPPPDLPAPRYYVLWVQPQGSGWLQYGTTTATSETVYGFPGDQYNYYVEAVGANYDTGPPTEQQATTTVSTTATWSETAFHTLYAVSGYGPLEPGASPPVAGPLWPGWDIVRGVTLDNDGDGGVVLDGFGGLHPFGDVTGTSSTAYWNGWDIAVGVASDAQNQGYVLDGWGGVHGFSLNGAPLPPAVNVLTGYWPGWKIARSIALFSDGSGGVVLDGWGHVHPFSVQGQTVTPAEPVVEPFWEGWDIARGVVLLPGSTLAHYGGYVLDGFGGLHSFGTVGDVPPPVSGGPYWNGWDIARGLVLLPGSSSSGYVLDGWGGFDPFGGAPAVVDPNYTPGEDIAKGIAIH